MKVTVEYYDSESFLIDEVIKQAKHNYGSSASVKVAAESEYPTDIIHFGIQRYITGSHLTLLFESGSTYQQDLKKLRAETLHKLGEILDEVIMENESRVSR